MVRLRLMVAVLVIAGLLLGACRPIVAEPVSEQANEDPLEANRQLMVSINEEIWNQGNLDLIDERYANDYVRHEAGYPAELAGAAGLKVFIQNLRTGFPDWNCTVEDTLAAGDEVMVRYLCSGTHTGEWNGLPPTGKPIQFQSIIVHRIADGKVVEDWSEYDSLGWMQQLGFELVPPQATTGLPTATVLVQGAQIRSPNGIKVGQDGNLYVASAMEQAILILDPDTGEILKRLGPEVGVDNPDDLAFGPDGSIYWTDFFRGSVGRLAPDGTTSSQIVAPGVNPVAVAADGSVLVGLAFLGDALYELDPELAAPPVLVAEGLGGLNSFEFGADGMLYAPVMDTGAVIRIDVDSDPIQIETVAEGLDGPVAVKFDSQGNLFAVASPGIVRVDPATGAVEPVAGIPYGLDNFAIDDQDRMYVSLLTEGTIAEVMADGTLRMLGATGLVLPGGLAVLPTAEGETIYLGDFWMLRQFDGATGAVLADPLGIPGGSVAADGEDLVLTNYFVNVVAVWNPQTGEMSETYFDFAVPLNAIRFQGDLIVVEAGTSSVVRADGADPSQRETIATNLALPAGLATDGDNLWVSDWATGSVWQIAAGGEILPEPKLIAEGLEQPEGMAVTPDGRLLVVETGTGRLLAIDLATGAVSTVAEGLGFDTVAPEGQPPTGIMSSVAVGPSGVIFVTGDAANVVYRIEPGE